MSKRTRLREIGIDSGKRLTLSERMPPYSRHRKYSKKIECRHTGGKKKKFPTFAGIKTQILLELQLKNCRILQKYK